MTEPSRPDDNWIAGGSKTGKDRFVFGYAIAIALFHLWANTIGGLPELTLNALHLATLGSLGFLSLAGRWDRTRVGRLLNHLAAIAIVLAGVGVILAEGPLHARGETMISADKGLAAFTVLLALWICGRTSGSVVPMLVVLSVSYVVLWGRYVDGIFHFRGLSLSRVLYRAAFTGEGLFGMIATISSSYVFMFLLFSAFLLKSGGGDFIMRLARRIMGRRVGGPGYIAVLTAGLMGTITGSAVANTVSTGSITIPLMKRSGFGATYSAAVCVAASTGGQLMPPIMGAGAFIMAQWTGQSYATVIAIALLPALLYFGSLLFHVFHTAQKLHVPMAEEGLAVEPWSRLLREGAHFFIPIATIVGLLAAGFSPTYAAGLSIGAVVAASLLTRKHRMGWRDVAEALALGARNMIPTGVLLVCTGLIIGSLNMTGVSVAFSQLVVDWSGGHLLPALILIALASLILGMGLPVTAAYVMMAVVAVPPLQEMGVSLLAAHMIVFWLSQDSNVTPPVCLAAFAGAGVAGSPPMATGLQAWQMSKALYVVPLLFAYTPLIDGSWAQRVMVTASAGCALFLFSAGMTRWLFRPLNLGQAAGAVAIALALLCPRPWILSLGLVAMALMIAWSWRTRVKSRQTL